MSIYGSQCEVQALTAAATPMQQHGRRTSHIMHSVFD